MYELGLRHTTGKLTIQIGERERLPFDISAIRTILFRRTDGGLVEARRLLVQALATGLQSGGDPVTSTRVWFEESLIEIDKVTEIEEILDEPGFLEKLADTEEGIAALGQTLVTATSIIGEISGIFSEGAAKASGLAQSGGPASAKLALANRIAALLENPANRLRIAATEFEKSIDRIEPGLHYLFGRLASEPDQLAEAGEFPEAISALVAASASSIGGALDFKATVEEIGNSTRSMRQVNRRIAAATQSFADSSKRVAEWKTLVEQLPSRKASI